MTLEEIRGMLILLRIKVSQGAVDDSEIEVVLEQSDSGHGAVVVRSTSEAGNTHRYTLCLWQEPEAAKAAMESVLER